MLLWVGFYKEVILVVIYVNGLVFEEFVRCMVDVDVFCLWLVCRVNILFIVWVIIGLILYFLYGVVNIMCRKFFV